MATENPLKTISGTAGSDVKTGRFVKRNATLTDTFDLNTGDTVTVDGVAAVITGVGIAVTAGYELAVHLPGGVVEMEAGAAIAANAEVMSDSTGRAITATGSTKMKLGRVVNNSTAGAAGDQVSVYLYPVGQAVVGGT